MKAIRVGQKTFSQNFFKINFKKVFLQLFFTVLKFDQVLKFRGFPLKINFWLICDLLKLRGFFPAPLDFNKKIWDFCEILVVIFSQGQK